MKKTIILKNGTIVTNKTECTADVKIEDGKIAGIGTFEDIVGAEVIDTSGSFLFPGLIDAHTHIDMGEGIGHTADDFYTGTKAAVAGGTTCLIDFATQDKGGTLHEALQVWKNKAEGRSHCHYGFHMAIVEWNDAVAKEMEEMVEQGVSSFKMYMAYPALRTHDGEMLKALQQAAKIGGLIGFHCENGDLILALVEEALKAGHTGPYYHMETRPPAIEYEAIFRLGEIAKLADAPIWVVHLSTKEGLEIVERLRTQGVDVVVETCPQYLTMTKEKYGDPEDDSFEAAKYVMSPPLRDSDSLEALWKGINNREIDLISTDHCPYNFKEQKEQGRDDFSKIPNGGPGIEHRLPLMYNKGVLEGRITLNQLVDLCSTKPAEIFGLSTKGAIEVGMDADLVVFNPETKWRISAETQHQNIDYTPYEGMEVQGQVEQVFLAGESVYQKGQFTEPKGQFVPRDKYRRR